MASITMFFSDKLCSNINSLVSNSVDLNTFNSKNLLAELICVRNGLCEIPNIMLSKEELNLMIVDVCTS